MTQTLYTSFLLTCTGRRTYCDLYITGGNRCDARWSSHFSGTIKRQQSTRIQLFRERLSEKNVHATMPKGDMGYDQYHCSWHWSCRNYFYWFRLALANIRPAFSCHSFKFFWRTVNSKPPKYLSGSSRELFPTTFLEIAVYGHRYIQYVWSVSFLCFLL